MINHDIVGLHIPMHDTLAVAEVQGLEQFENVETNIVIGEAGVQCAEVGVVDSLEDQTRSLALVVANNIQQCHNIGPTSEILQNLDLTLDLLLLDRLENLDNAFLVVDDVDAFENLRVLSPT
jgi:L-lactate utilization protein LutC